MNWTQLPKISSAEVSRHLIPRKLCGGVSTTFPAGLKNITFWGELPFQQLDARASAIPGTSLVKRRQQIDEHNQHAEGNEAHTISEDANGRLFCAKCKRKSTAQQRTGIFFGEHCAAWDSDIPSFVTPSLRAHINSHNGLNRDDRHQIFCKKDAEGDVWRLACRNCVRLGGAKLKNPKVYFAQLCER